MSQTMVNFRMDEDVKRKMEQACKDMGMSMTTAFTIFAVKVGNERRIPFEITADPFYSESNMRYLRRVIGDIESICRRRPCRCGSHLAAYKSPCKYLYRTFRRCQCTGCKILCSGKTQRCKSGGGDGYSHITFLRNGIYTHRLFDIGARA